MLYCTLLAKAESDAERERIEEEMGADPEKKAILKVSFSHTYSIILPPSSPPHLYLLTLP